MTQENHLFGALKPAATVAVLVVPTDPQQAKLTPAQKRFNTLLGQVSKLSASLEMLEALSVRHRSSHLQAVALLQQQSDAACKKLLLFLHSCLQQDAAASADLAPTHSQSAAKPLGLTASHRRSATQIILSLCEALAHWPDAQVQAVFEQYRSEDERQAQAQAQAEAAQAGVAYAKSVMEDLLGKPLEGVDHLDSAEAIFQAGLRQHQAQMQRLEEKRQARKAKKKPTAQQLKAEQQAMDAHTALRTVYRQLASALHPDREPDEAERVRKTALMSEVNAAYDQKNLSALLKLQLQISQIDSAHLSRLSDDKLNAMCLLLKAQVQTLEEAQAQAQADIRYALDVHTLDHISEQSLARALAMQLHDKADALASLEQDWREIQNTANLKRWLKAQAQQAKQLRAQKTFNVWDDAQAPWWSRS